MLFSLLGGEGKIGRAIDSVECYNPVTNQWTEVRSLPESRVDHSSCTYLNSIYVCGGRADTSSKEHLTKSFWYVMTSATRCGSLFSFASIIISFPQKHLHFHVAFTLSTENICSYLQFKFKIYVDLILKKNDSA